MNVAHSHEKVEGSFDRIRQILTDPWLASGFGASILKFVLWGWSLKYFDVGYATLFVCLNNVFVVGFGYFLFKEPVPQRNVLAVALIIGGVLWMSL